MNFEYFIRCANCGYPLALETYYDFAYVGERYCPDCGFWETNPNLDDAKCGVDLSTVQPDSHRLFEQITCRTCGSDVVVLGDFCRSEYDYRLTVFCPSCRSYKRYTETDIQPELPPRQPSGGTACVSDLLNAPAPESRPGGITL